jgi:isopenicillin N synthase-like dioxygenase
MALLLWEKKHVASASAEQEWLGVRPTHLESHVDYQTISLMAQKNQKGYQAHAEVELVVDT